MNTSSQNGFYQLTPDDVLNAIEDCGFMPTGEFQQLNSYENRVFDIKVEDDKHPRLIAKFYRPQRWSQDALLDEHQFLFDLASEGIEVTPPLAIDKKTNLSVRSWNGIYFSLFPRFSGRMPQEFISGELKQIGRTLARIHNVGSQKKALYRPQMHPKDYGWRELDELQRWVDRSLWSRYQEASSTLLEFLEDELSPESYIRIHGDCHKGNILQNQNNFLFVDFDDFLNGPVAQDFWMLFSGEEHSEAELDEVLSGYEELRSFPDQQFELFSALRGWRILHYAAWIAKRWEDPSFPKLFPDFNSFSYWAEETEALEKIAWQL